MTLPHDQDTHHEILVHGGALPRAPYGLAMIRLICWLSAAVLICCVAACAPGSGSRSAAGDWPGCDSFDTQREAQRYFDRHRPDRAYVNKDGRVCVSLAGGRSKTTQTTSNAPSAGDGCRTQRKPVVVLLSRASYPQTTLHIEHAVAAGQPWVLEIERAGEDAKRDEWERVSGDGWDVDGDGQTDDRDEWPMAMTSRAGGAGRTASVALVAPSDNRGAGATIANRLRAFCDGQRFKVCMHGRRPAQTSIVVIAHDGRGSRQTVTSAPPLRCKGPTL